MGAGEKTQDKILRAAEAVFVRHGYEGATMEQIAAEAGVLKANIYYYFAGKDELYNSLIDNVLDKVFGEVSGFLTVSTSHSPWDRLDAFLDVFFALIDRYRGLLALAFGELLHPPKDDGARSRVVAMLDQIERLAIFLIEDGIAKGDFADRNPAQTLLSLEGAVYYYFLMPEQRLQAITGYSKFDSQALADRKQHLSDIIRRILGRE